MGATIGSIVAKLAFNLLTDLAMGRTTYELQRFTPEMGRGDHGPVWTTRPS